MRAVAPPKHANPHTLLRYRFRLKYKVDTFSKISSFAVFRYPFPRYLRCLVEFVLDLLYTISARDEKFRNNERIRLSFGFLKLPPCLIPKYFIPWFTRLLVGPMKVFGRS